MSWPRCQHDSVPLVCARSSASTSVGFEVRVRSSHMVNTHINGQCTRCVMLAHGWHVRRCDAAPDLYEPIARIADMVNLDMIHGMSGVGRGCPGLTARAPTPTAPTASLSSPEVQEVRAEAMAKKGVEASSKPPTKETVHPRKKVKVSSNRHKSWQRKEGSKSHTSKSKERVGAAMKHRLLDPDD
ncbi:hypothetical protein B296_00013362 [Ensete ventricosum]|uniref:Uncharacterized protein n=1 Tax=Ensete ventricosum TaxID=4639 RepID=A0A426Y6A1_ENSVE|nr:hypothetical protein B296_00013362 [Ensete ventricosum]